MSEVRRFGRDFDSRQLTKTLTLKFERLQSKINTTFLSEKYKWKQAHHQPFQVHSRGRCGGYDQLQQEVDQLCRGAHQKGTQRSIWWEILQQLFAPLKCPITKPFAALVESPMGRLSSCLIRANLDGSDGPPVFYALLVISRNLGGRDAITLPGKYMGKKQKHEIFSDLVGSDALSLLDIIRQ